MPPRLRVLLALVTVSLSLGSLASAAPAPKAPKAVREVITVERTATHGLAALALIGKVRADRVPGFFAVVDRGRYGSTLEDIVDFNGTSGLTRYGHGSEEPLCGAPVVCSVDVSTNTLTFTLTTTDDADDHPQWNGMTRYFALEGTKIDLTYAAVGFKVTRHARPTFARVTRERADLDGVGVYGLGAELFRSAQLRGGPRGSFAVLQLPCESVGVGAATFAATGDTLPSVVNCAPEPAPSVYAGPSSGVSTWGGRPGLFSRSAGKATQWQVSGAVSGLSSTLTRLFVLSY